MQTTHAGHGVESITAGAETGGALWRLGVGSVCGCYGGGNVCGWASDGRWGFGVGSYVGGGGGRRGGGRAHAGISAMVLRLPTV